MTASAASGGELSVQGISMHFGEVAAVEDASFTVRPGEFLTFLGPSGSGKTTTLRMIAGFVEPDKGTIELDGRSLVGVPPHRRDIGMVFQHYALFPHMTAAQNVAFPLEMRSVPRPEIRRRVQEMLEMVGLGGRGGYYPRELSGGQQQRVAFARAVVFHPRLLLMDEPLGALDKKLREALQLELMRIHRMLGATVVYVTHDQEEALFMSDRIGIFRSGKIEQIARGDELYERPASRFVADFIGESNLVAGRLLRASDEVRFGCDLGSFRAPPQATIGRTLEPGAEAVLVLRPERLRILPAEGQSSASDTAAIESVPGTVQEVIYLGSTRKVVVSIGGGAIWIVRSAVTGSDQAIHPGASVRVGWLIGDGILVPSHV